ncbi:NAD(P)/FAD-dependent oxidoreductase, partial [Parapedobacter lycopersici]|uniref:NAD(P)/FAD-dependent oxidoreductase n=1 Tax=Parapedobacter lycopersici TaxID=1864939 RepID=UPI0033417CB9
MKEQQTFDVIIIGGSYAGLSAAMALGRSLRQVLIIDGGLPCNRQTPHSHNFLTQDGVAPREIADLGKSQVLQYDTVRFHDDTAVNGRKSRAGFEIDTQSGRTFMAKKLIFATGLRDIMPNIPGFAGCWGISAIHCPYCHGYEYHGQQTGILANGDAAHHYASLVSNLTRDLTVLTNGKPSFTPDQEAHLAKQHIQVVAKEVGHIDHSKGQIRQVVFKDGSVLPFTVLYAGLPQEQHSDIPGRLGCALNERGLLTVDGLQKTSVDGVFAAGDNSSMFRSVAFAVSTGNLAGAACNKELAEERFLN